jgi:capsular polysaccharide biosynthesis protein
MLLIGAASLAASLLVAAAVTVASLLQTPKYEASARVLVGQAYPPPPSDCSPHPSVKVKYSDQSDSFACGIHPIPIPPPQDLQGLVHKMTVATHSRPVAKETIGRLGLKMSPDKLLNNLTVEQDPGTMRIDLTYTNTDPTRVKRVANTVGPVASELVSSVATGVTASHVTAVVRKKANLPSTPVSPKPLRNGLIALVLALMLSVIIVAWREDRRSPR